MVRLTTRGTHEVVVLVDKLDRATLQALSYGLDLGATSIRAVHAAADPDRAARLARRWMELQAPVPLDVIECWDRDIPRALERYVVAMASDTSEVTAVMPRRDYPKIRQRLLHDRTSRQDPARAGALRARRRRGHPVLRAGRARAARGAGRGLSERLSRRPAAGSSGSRCRAP